MLEKQSSSRSEAARQISHAIQRAAPKHSWFWDMYARWYDKISRTRAYQEMMADVVEAIGLRPGQRILDVGCGTGNLHQNLKKSTSDFELVGLDFSDSMLRVAVHKNPGGDYRLRDLNQFPWPFEDASFDTIACVNNLYTLTDPKRILNEMKRVLKPGGRVVIANPKPGTNVLRILSDHWNRSSFSERLEVVCKIHKVIAILGINAVIANRGNKHDYHFIPPEKLCDMAITTGFSIDGIAPTYAGENILAILRKEKIFCGDYTFKSAETLEEIEGCYQLRYRVYCEEKGYYPVDQFKNQRETDEYDLFSHHIIALDDFGEIVGAIRVIDSAPEPLPIQRDFQVNDPGGRAVELSRLIIKPAYRGNRKILFGICKQIYEYAQKKEIAFCYALTDKLLLASLLRMGFPFEIIGPERWYHGHIVVPSILSVEVAKEKVSQF